MFFNLLYWSLLNILKALYIKDIWFLSRETQKSFKEDTKQLLRLLSARYIHSIGRKMN